MSRCLEAAVSAVPFVKDTTTALGVTAARRVDRAHASLGASRLRALIHGRRCSGCVPGRCYFDDDFILAMASGVYYGYLQSFYAMGHLQIWAAVGAPGAGDGWWWRSPTRLCTVAREFRVISVFYRGLCASSLGQLSTYPVSSYLYWLMSLYVFLGM